MGESKKCLNKIIILANMFINIEDLFVYKYV